MVREGKSCRVCGEEVHFASECEKKGSGKGREK